MYRYVYQPLDSLYLLVITNRASNIVEDLETIRLLSKGNIDACTDAGDCGCGSIPPSANRSCNIGVMLSLFMLTTVIPDIAGATNNIAEERVVDCAYDLIFAFDEVSCQLCCIVNFRQEFMLCCEFCQNIRLLQQVDTENQLTCSRSGLTWKWKATKKSYII